MLLKARFYHSSCLFFFLLFGTATLKSQTATLFDGNWTNASNWNAGVPASDEPASVTNDMDLNTSLTISDDGVYTVDGGSVIDDGGSYDITVQGGSVGGELDVDGNVTILGHLLLKNSGKLFIRSGDTLRVGSMEARNNTSLEMESGSVLIIAGDFLMKNNFVGNVDGQILVEGSFTGRNSALISGGGNLEVNMSTTYNNSSSAFGSVSDCSPGPCEYGSGAGLPVDLTSFSAQINASHQLIVNWETASEVNNDYFVLFYSLDGENFYELKKVEGSGNSITLKEYSERFSNFMQSTIYLKLRQVDYDGTFKDYRAIVAKRNSTLNEASDEILVYPNPTEGILRLKCHNRAILLDQVHVYTFLVQDVGSDVKKELISDSEVQLDISPLPAGNYLLFIGQESHKIIKR